MSKAFLLHIDTIILVFGHVRPDRSLKLFSVQAPALKDMANAVEVKGTEWMLQDILNQIDEQAKRQQAARKRKAAEAIDDNVLRRKTAKTIDDNMFLSDNISLREVHSGAEC